MEYLQPQWYTMILFLVWVGLFILILFAFKNKLQKKESINIQKRARLDDLAKDKRVQEQIVRPLISLLKETTYKLEKFDQYTSDVTMAHLKKDLKKSIKEIIENDNFEAATLDDDNQKLISLVQKLERTSPATWVKNYGDEIEEVLNGK